MSGFIAIVHCDNAPINAEILDQLTESLYFRGPDRQQVWLKGNAGLGHALLRTTREAEHENQPASLDNEVWITGCIRIDAREELVEKLGLNGKIRLDQTPDSHLVLWAYEAWDEHCPEHLLGDFSFAIWDGRKQRLFCARDRFGMRQLVYAVKNDTFIVSNSIDCLRQHPLVSDRLCDAAIADFLLFGDHRWGSRARTSFEDIRALEPAHCLSLSASRQKIRRYWDLQADIPLLHLEKDTDYIERFHDIMKVAVSDRMRTRDIFIPISGGMDSSSIAATIIELNQQGSLPTELSTATVLYDAIHPSDERQFAAEVTGHLQLPSHFIDASQYPFLSPTVMTTAPVELYQPQLWLDLDQYAYANSRVLLNGNGGDEILAFTSARNALLDMGIIRVIASILRLKRLYGRYPPFGSGIRKMTKAILGKTTGPAPPYPYPKWIDHDLEQRLDLKDRWSGYWSAIPQQAACRNPKIYELAMSPDWNTDDRYLNCGTTLPEHRSPFLDPRLISFLVSLPALPWLFNKHILRESMSGKLPENVLRRPKTPLGFLHESLLKNTDDRVLNHWKPDQALPSYVDYSKLPVMDKTSAAGNDAYINLRPLLLNQWLSGLGNSVQPVTSRPVIHRVQVRF